MNDDRAAIFFESADEFRVWLEAHHATETEVWVGFYKKGSGKTGLTYPESVDQALCFGWIDGKSQRIDDAAYRQRFTPRRPRSNWSEINVRKVAELTERGLMHPAGIAAFEARSEALTGVYSYEQTQGVALPPEYVERFRHNDAAWQHFDNQAPWYRRVAAHYVMSAKREATRSRRLDELIEASAQGKRIKQVLPRQK